MTIAVTGATGQLGRLAIAQLKRRASGADILALARDPAKASDLGVATRVADYRQPETLRGALADVETLVLISSSDLNDRTGQHRNVIEAAQASGVRRLIYTSILKADRNPMLLAQDHRATEGMLAETALVPTILRNGWYTENYTAGLAGALAAGAMIGAAGAGELATAERADYAEAIAVVAADEGHEGKVYELAGDEAYTLADMAAEASRRTEETIPYQDLPPEAYAEALQGFGLPEPVARAIADADAQAAKGWLFDDGETLGRLIGRPTTPMASSVASALNA